MKICLVFNKGAHYRSAIYEAIDKHFDCDWYFDHCENEMNTKLLKNVNFTRTQTFIRKPLSYQKGILRLSFHREYDCYILLGSPYFVSTWLLIFLIKIFNRKSRIYLWGHGLYGKESFLRLKIKKLFFLLPNGIFTYGDYAKELFVRCGFSGDTIYPIYNSLNYNYHLSIRKQLRQSDVYIEHFGNKAPVLIFIGRLTPVKRLEMMVEALSLLKSQGMICNLVFIGDGTEKQKLEQKVHDMNLVKNVWFYGESFDDIKNANLIFNADLCISPGNVGLTAIHSLTFGTPVITHNDFTRQMPEFEAIKSKVTGSFFKINDINSLTNEIQNWLLYAEGKRDIIRKACYEEIDNKWNPNIQIKVLESVLK